MNIVTDKITAQIKKIAGQKSQIIAGYLFGSYQTGKQCLTSDIDLGFLCFDKADLDIPFFAHSVSKLLLPKEADVVVCDLKEKPLILIEIINGKVIFQKNLKDRVFLESMILKLYEDYLHLQSIKNYYLDKSFTEGIYANK